MKAILSAVAVFFALSCAPSHGVMSKQGFSYEDYYYSVPFKDPDKRYVLDKYWYIDNWKHEDTVTEWSLKNGRDYLGYRIVDRDDDGTPEKEEAYFFDLLLKHKTTDGVIWIQTFDLHEKYKWIKLDVLIDNYVDSLAGTGMYAEGNIYSILQKKERKYASNKIESEPVALGPYKAIRATIELIDLDQLKAVPDYKGRKLEIVVAKIDAIHVYQSTTVEAHYGIAREKGKSVMLIGYHNTAKHFNKCLKDFDEFLERIKIETPPDKESENEPEKTEKQ